MYKSKQKEISLPIQTQLTGYTKMNVLLFSFSDIFTYWDIITQYVNPATIIIWAIVGGIVGFLIVLITEIILRKKILVKRRHWSLKALAYIYMVFLPLFTGYCFTQWFAIHACERELVKNIPTYLGDANSAFNKYLKEEVEKRIAARYLKLTGHEALDKGVSYAANLANELIKTTDEKLETKLSDYFSQSDFIKKQAANYMAEKIGEQLMMDKDLTHELLDVKIQNLLNDGALDTLIEKHIKNFTGGMKMNVLLLFFIVLAIPIIEIILANYLEKKRIQQVSDGNR
jgi:hypothetical protein